MFWENFVKLCTQNNVKPNPVAAKLGFSSASVTKWKKGTKPNDTTLRKIADYFGVSVDYLLGKEEQKEKAPGTESETGPTLNTIRIAGRDGRLIEKHLTDEQLDAWMKIIESLPDADF